MEKQLQSIAHILKSSRDLIAEKIAQLIEQNKQLTKEVAHHKQKSAHRNINELSAHVKKVGDVSILIEEIKNSDRESLRHMIDQLKQQLGDAIILLATIQDEKIIYVASVSKNLTTKITAPDVLKAAGGKGGGRPDMAQGGSDDPATLPAALAAVEDFVKNTYQ